MPGAAGAGKLGGSGFGAAERVARLRWPLLTEFFVDDSTCVAELEPVMTLSTLALELLLVLALDDEWS